MPESVEKLEIWREAVEIVKAVYRLSQSWPREELYGLTNQVRRAAVSVPANFAEGLGRGRSREMARFAQIALGSLYELDTLLHLAAELGFSPQDLIVSLRERITALAKRTSSFIHYQEHRT
ncbi:MAG: four helix bundle protein [Chloroflexi bacterium]|nr:MAG: four helix bundle protein [Chloroflexota bacterium]